MPKASVLKFPEGESPVVKRVTRSREEDAHGGAWKVAFADFCLALLCLFLVMWLMAVRHAEELQELLKAAGGNLLDEGRGRMAESLGSPPGSLIAHEPLSVENHAVIRPRQSSANADAASDVQPEPRLMKKVFETNADMAELAVVLGKLAEQAGVAGNVQSVVTPYGLRVILHDTDKTGMFPRGSAVADQRFVALFRRIGPIFAQISNQLMIVGHTDSIPYRDRAPGGRGPAAISNWTLSSDRAVAARAYLLMGGMPASSVLQVAGLADRAPFNVNDTSASENRRIELVVLSSGQAQYLSAMFRAPTQMEPLVDGVSTSLPDADALAALRGRLVTSR